jgi:hypothetical protein
MLKKLSVLLLVLALVSVCPGVPAEEPASPERIEAEFPKIYASSKMDMLFCLVSTENRTRMIWCGDGAEALVRAAFPDYDGSGSLIFEPKAPRKSKVVPPLTRALEEKQK